MWSGVREEKQSDELLFRANVAASKGRLHRASENYDRVNSVRVRDFDIKDTYMRGLG